MMKQEAILAAAAIAPTTFAPQDLLLLARQYGATACAMMPSAKETGWSPFRFCLIHAVELCLSALMAHGGHSDKEIRSLQHDLAARAAQCAPLGLKLRKKNLTLLGRLSESGLYTGARYRADSLREKVQPNQLIALFSEVAEKVCKLIAANAPQKLRVA